MHFSIHEDGNGEWVLRINNANGSYAGLGVLNGKLEAETIRDVLQGALELAVCCESRIKQENINNTDRIHWERGMKNASNMVEGRRLRELL